MRIRRTGRPPRRAVVTLLAAFAVGPAAVLSAAAPAVGAVRPASAASSAASSAGSPLVRVVVQAGPTQGAAVATAVRRLGGRVGRPLPIVHGFAAALPAPAVPRLLRTPGVAAVTPDERMRVQAGGPAPDLPSVYPQVTRATDVRRAGYAGSGVTVALVDTGVADLPDLADRMVPVPSGPLGLSSAPCINFSGEPTCADSYGHGTFIAGLIAGTGAASGGRYTGIAPAARVLSVKIAGRDGSADVSTVIAAIQWVVSYQSRYDIRVLNLSLGTDSTQSYRHDPLDYAVEKAWAAGITVVVAASNRGPAAGTISKPGDDPFVITVGALDDRGTPGRSDDAVPDFSSRGPTAADGLAKPDVAAPGAHLVSLSAPGSSIAAQFPSTMPAPYRRGSGTSMATGVVSGVAALLLSRAPSATPDRVKYALTATAVPDAGAGPDAVGAGLVDAYDAAFTAPAGLANQGVDRSDGTGSLAASRGSVQLEASATVGTPLISGSLTAQLNVFDPLDFLGASWTPLTWPLSQWAGSNWAATSWVGSNWEGSNWEGSNWEGGQDTTSSYGSNWEGSAWYGAWDR